MILNENLFEDIELNEEVDSEDLYFKVLHFIDDLGYDSDVAKEFYQMDDVLDSLVKLLKRVEDYKKYESLKESKNLNEWWSVDLEYPDLGDYGYTYEAYGDDVLEYLVDLAWDFFDTYAINLPEYSYLKDLSNDELNAWCDDDKNFEEFTDFVEANFDKFFRKYEDDILEHFEEKAAYEYYNKDY